MIAIDTETTLITDDEPIPRLVCVSLDDGRGAVLLHHSDERLPALLARVLAGEVCSHNLPFDLAVLRRRFPQLAAVIWALLAEDRGYCSYLAQRLLDISDGNLRRAKGSYGLATLAGRLLGLEVDKSDSPRLTYGALLDVPCELWSDEQREYALDDATLHRAVWEAQQRDRFVDGVEPPDGTDLLADLPRQLRRRWALELQAAQGMEIDHEQLEQLDEGLEVEILRHRDAMEAAGLIRLVGKRAPRWQKSETHARALADQFAREHELPIKRGAKGPSISEDSLNLLGVPDDHPLHHYQRYGSVLGQRTKYLDKLRGKKVARGRWAAPVATGRTSCSDPPLQQWPREGGFREVFRAREGRVFLIADLVAAEFASWAQILLDLFDESDPAEALRAGKNPHTLLAVDLFAAERDRLILEQVGIPPDVITYEGFDKKIHAHGEMYKLAKAVNFGFMGGLGPLNFRGYARGQYGLDLSIDQAYDSKSVWLRRWSQAEAYFQFIQGCIEAGGGFANLQQVRSLRCRGGCFFSDGANTLFQGLTADLAGDLQWELARECYTDRSSDLYDAPTVFFAHDEFVLEPRIEQAEAAAERLRYLAEQVVGPRWLPDVPTRIEYGIEPRYTKI